MFLIDSVLLLRLQRKSTNPRALRYICRFSHASGLRDAPSPKLWVRNNSTKDSVPDSVEVEAAQHPFRVILNDFLHGETPRRIFASSTDTGTGTGVCRVLALSIGSDVTCTTIS